MSALYPFSMQPAFDPRPWGTLDLSPIYPNHKFGEKIGEAWLTGDACKVANGPLKGKSLADLRLDYLDMYLVHWPFPNFHPPGCDVTARSKDAKPYIHGNYMKTWAAMQELVKRGLVRHIGTSNMTIPKLKLLLRDARIPPAVNEMELHPHFQQPALFDFVHAHGIAPVGYSPLGSPGRPSTSVAARSASRCTR